MIKITRPECPHPKALENKNYKHPKNKEALAQSTNGKCMYCESKIDHVNYGHVEHIKPKAANLFPELEFSWANLGYVCDICNNAKNNKYFEGLEFIDPYSEDPSEQMTAYGAFILSRDGSERAEITINEIDLNRTQLIERRNTRIKSIHSTYTAICRTKHQALKISALTELKKEIESDKEFAMVTRELFRHLNII